MENSSCESTIPVEGNAGTTSLVMFVWQKNDNVKPYLHSFIIIPTTATDAGDASHDEATLDDRETCEWIMNESNETIGRLDDCSFS